MTQSNKHNAKGTESLSSPERNIVTPEGLKSHLDGESEVGGPEALIRCIKTERKYQTWEMIVIKI